MLGYLLNWCNIVNIRLQKEINSEVTSIDQKYALTGDKPYILVSSFDSYSETELKKEKSIETPFLRQSAESAVIEHT